MLLFMLMLGLVLMLRLEGLEALRLQDFKVAGRESDEPETTPGHVVHGGSSGRQSHPACGVSSDGGLG